MSSESLPKWWRSLTEQHRQGVGRVFILHDNVNDLVYYPPAEEDVFRMRPRPFRDMLIYLLLTQGKAIEKTRGWDEESPFPVILYASPTIPLTFYHLKSNPETDTYHISSVLADLKKLQTNMAKSRILARNEWPQFLDAFARDITSEERAPQQSMTDLLFAMEPYLEQVEPEWIRIILILDFLEKITTEEEDRSNYKTEEILRRWALSDSLKKSSHLVVGITVHLKALPKPLYRPESQIQAIPIPMPKPDDRLRFLYYWQQPIAYDSKLKMTIGNLGDGDKIAGAPDETSSNEIQERRVSLLAGLTKGFRLLNLEAMVRMAKANNPEGEIDHVLLKEQKARLIEEESSGLLEEIEFKRGFGAIGGLDYAKKYFTDVGNELIQSQSTKIVRSIPKGILLAGPPGTGKTILAEAVAAMGGMTLVKLGDIRNSYVGQSEQNMTRVLDLLQALSPVVVFIDEIDQVLGQRGTGVEGDSGVNRRLFAKFLEFMGNNDNRGKVLWIGASNRPDILDQAIISRFDTVMAILPPYAVEERLSILEVMERNIGGIKYSENLKAALRNIAEDLAYKVPGVSGRAIETIVRKAALLKDWSTVSQDRLSAPGGKIIVDVEDIRRAIDLYKSNADTKQVDEMTIKSLMMVNFVDMMPQDTNLYPPRLQSFVKMAISGPSKSNAPLEKCLEKLRDGTLYESEQN